MTDRALWLGLLEEARSGATTGLHGIHGEQHWAAVAGVGLAITALRPLADPQIVLAFGMLHDCRRINDDYDPEHGARAAQALMHSKFAAKLFTKEELSLLGFACIWHDKGRVAHNAPTIAACWDADRYNLLRLGITPDPGLLSSQASKQEYQLLCKTASDLMTRQPDWDDLITFVLDGHAKNVDTTHETPQGDAPRIG